MATWCEFAEKSPELAKFGEERLKRGVAYLATLKKDGSPRVHPVTPILGAGRLFLFMEPTSPKGEDLKRDGRYAMHSLVTLSSGEEGEFFINGVAQFTDDKTTRETASQAASYPPAERYILFELSVTSAFSNVYVEGKSRLTSWRESV